MKKILSFLIIATLLAACGSNASYSKAENALDAGREFIDGCLKGEFKKANHYMLEDEPNRQDLDKVQQVYLSKGSQEKVQYNNASIIIDSVTEESDSVTIIHYRTSLDKIAKKVKVVKQDDTWKVDYKQYYDGRL